MCTRQPTARNDAFVVEWSDAAWWHRRWQKVVISIRSFRNRLVDGEGDAADPGDPPDVGTMSPDPDAPD